jgi:hypothetical protein
VWIGAVGDELGHSDVAAADLLGQGAVDAGGRHDLRAALVGVLATGDHRRGR